MVAVEAPPPRFTEKEYLALEAVADTKHEYIGGDIIGMAGAELSHNVIVQNVRLELGNALRGKPCLVIGADQRVKVEASTEYFYPDVVITCLEPRLAEDKPPSLLNPQVIVEVLSPTTESRDRGVKWLAYQLIPTLTDYVTIASDRRRVEHFQRGPDRSWTQRTITEGAVTLSSGVRLEVSSLYEGTGH